MGPRVDYHVHTTLSKHAVGSMEEYVLFGVKAGLSELGFADHLPDVRTGGSRWTMDEPQLPHYVEAVQALADRFPQLRIRLGIEADFLPGFESAVAERLARHPFDYVIGSVHWVPSPWGGERLITSRRFWRQEGEEASGDPHDDDVNAAFCAYHERLRESAGCGLFHVMAHCDVVHKFGHLPTLDTSAEHRRTAEVFSDTRVLVELNTSGLRAPLEEIHPGREFLGALRDAGVGVTLGSDAHRPEHVGFGIDAALERAREAGFRAIHVCAGAGRFEERPI